MKTLTTFKQFQFKAIDKFAQKQRGEIVAENKDQARIRLIQQGFNKISLQQNWQLSTQPKISEIYDLLLQLANLLQASVPLKQCLQLLKENSTNVQLYSWLNQILKDIETGITFHQAVEQHQGILTIQEQQLIKVGELTGNLATVCSQLAEHKKRILIQNQKLQKILLYPIMVLTVSIILTLLLLIFIVPQFAEMYGDNQQNLPFFTLVLLNISHFLQDYFIYLTILTTFLIYLLKFKLTNNFILIKIKTKFQSIIPVISDIIKLSRLINLSQSLQLMLQSGMPLNQALQAFLPKTKTWQKQSIQGDNILLEEIQFISKGIRQGYSFANSISSRIFPMQAQQMLKIAEKTGNLPEMLGHISQSYSSKLDHKMDLISQMIEPILMLVIGGLIGLIMLGMYLPIFNMGSMIQ